MKRVVLMVLLITAVFISCNETGTSVFSVNQEEVTSAAEGTMIIYIDQDGEPFDFTGNLTLVDGQCHVLLQSPVLYVDSIMDTIQVVDYINSTDTVFKDSTYVASLKDIRDTLYNEIFLAPTDIKFDQQFDRKIGEWLFSYEISKYDDVAPYGNFDFTFSYNN